MLEIGIIEHEGQHFAANGATCDGRSLTAYVADDHSSPVTLKTRDGKALATLRSLTGLRFRVNDYGDEGETLLLRCGGGHFIGGLSLGGGRLFRGVHIMATDACHAAYQADEVARCFAEQDYYDSLREVDD